MEPQRDSKHDEALLPAAPLAPAVPPAGAPPRLWNRNFGLLWMGQSISQLGNQAFSVAMAFWLVEATGSASLMGLLLTASSLPGIVLGPLGGVVADRFPRIRIAVLSDLVGGVAMTGLALVMLTGRAGTSTIVALLFVVGILMGTVRAFFGPALSAAVPDLVPRERLVTANSLNQITLQASLLVGQGIGGILYSWLGAPLLFLIDGLTYFFASGSESFIRLPPLRRADAESAGAGAAAAAFRRFAADLKEGFAYVRSTTGLLPFLLASSGYNFFVMPVIVLLPFYVTDYLHQGARWYGFMLAAISAGQITGFVGSGAIRLPSRAKATFITWLMILAPVPFALVGVVRSGGIALAVAYVLGAAVGTINVHLITVMQATTPDELRGRVMGLVATLGGAVIPLGMALGGIAGDLTGKNIPLIYTFCGVASFLFTLITLNRGKTREFLSRA